MLAFGKNLKALREKAGYNQKELAKAIGVSQVTMISYENYGKLPQRESIKKALMDKLKCTEIDLYGFTDGYYSKHSNKCLSHYEYAVINLENDKRHVDKNIQKKFPNGKFIKIKDESMNKEIPNNSYCYIYSSNQLRNNKFYAVKTPSEEIIIRKIEINNKTIKLIPETYNNEFETIKISKNDKEYQILGQIVWFSKDCD